MPRQDLGGAIAANSVGFNLSRAVGPALGGIAIAALGIAIPFWIFCISNFGIIAALLWWRAPRKASDTLPAERLTSAVRTGVRYAANNQYLRATLVRAFAFFPFGSAYWALLPLVARSQMSEGPQLYGILLGAIGAGAIAGSLALNSASLTATWPSASTRAITPPRPTGRPFWISPPAICTRRSRSQAHPLHGDGHFLLRRFPQIDTNTPFGPIRYEHFQQSDEEYFAHFRGSFSSQSLC